MTGRRASARATARLEEARAIGEQLASARARTLDEAGLPAVRADEMVRDVRAERDQSRPTSGS